MATMVHGHGGSWAGATMDPEGKDNVKGKACLGCKRNGLGKKPHFWLFLVVPYNELYAPEVRARGASTMKVNPMGYGMLEIVAENDAERVWFGILLKEIEKNHRPFLSHYFRVDLEDMCKKED